MPVRPESLPISADLPGGLARALDGCGQGRLSANVALMHLFMESATPADAARALKHAESTLRALSRTDEAARIASVRALWDASPNAWETVRAILACVPHDAHRALGHDAVRGWSAAFDRAAAVSGEGSVALYSLGRADILAKASDEIMDLMRRWGLLGGIGLEIGCGIGRILERLAPEMHLIAGVDISLEMLRRARARCMGLPNVTLTHTSGRDLQAFADRSFDLVYAVDTWPYLVLAGGGIAHQHVQETARVLKPNGAALILNYSYRGNPELDSRELAQAAGPAGLLMERQGAQEFSSWNGKAFLLRK
jgi:SAM-dependent methyltransferase